MSQLKDDVVTHIIHGAVCTVIAVKVVVKLFELPCCDGPCWPTAASSWVGVLCFQPLDEVLDIFLETCPFQVLVAVAVR